MTLLSNPAPVTMSRPAFARSAVSSTTAGGLPGPAHTARLPDCIAALTTPGPPVTTSKLMPLWCISAVADSMVGIATAVIRLGGPPAATAAAFSARTVASELRRADGCALNTTAFPAATMPMVLQMIVLVGLVVGVMAPMTPKGAHSVSVSP